MTQGSWPTLLSPIRIGPMTLAHRAIMSAHGMGLGAGGPGVSDRYHAYLLERARDVHEAGSKLSITLWHGGHKDGSLRGRYRVTPSRRFTTARSPSG